MRRKLQFLVGVISTLIGSLLVCDGGILGENTIDIAIVMSIMGVGLMTTSKFRLFK
ncbi:MAG: hypothetical protein NDF54_00790 [archaeon GB-1867-035]|nr:hypothetical protein [Candidatus Culexmicrobium profundum]